MEQAELDLLNAEIDAAVQEAFDAAQAAEEPRTEDLLPHRYAPAAVTEERGQRHDPEGETTLMVDCALHAMQEIMEDHPEALLYGQDVGARLGGVFREAATLGQKFGDHRVFNTPIQEAFIIGSTVGMSATGCKPIVEVQFADYLWPGLNQLFTELSRSYMLSNGQWPVHSLIRVPIGAYGSGGPYHSSSIESVLANIRGVKVAYPSNGADLKGLLKAAYEDPNPVVVLEHKGLYWSKIPGTESAKVVEPDRAYRVPLGKARVVIAADDALLPTQSAVTVVTYGRGVHWAQEAAQAFQGRIEFWTCGPSNRWITRRLKPVWRAPTGASCSPRSPWPTVLPKRFPATSPPAVSATSTRPQRWSAAWTCPPSPSMNGWKPPCCRVQPRWRPLWHRC